MISYVSFDETAYRKDEKEEFVNVLKRRNGDRVHKIILFGSTVREAEDESDIDVLIVADGVSQKEVSKISLQILLKYGEVISPIVEHMQQFEKNSRVIH